MYQAQEKILENKFNSFYSQEKILINQKSAT